MLIEMVFVTLAAVAAEPEGAPQHPNAVFAALVEEGIAIVPDGGKKVALPRPSMPEGASLAEQRKIIAELPGNRPYDDMVRNAIVAPFAMRIEDVENPAGDPLRRVDVWFVAYGRLQQFFDERQATSLVQWATTDKKPSSVTLLSADDLRRHSIVPTADNHVREQFLFRQGVLLDRVRVGATYRVMTTLEPNAVVIAAVIDPRFNEDEKYPNYWQSIAESGEPGPRQRYVTAGAYCKVSPLVEPNGAIFVEQHFLFAEPHGWFRGAPLLRSKLPLAIQDSVRQLRRQLRTGGDVSGNSVERE